MTLPENSLPLPAGFLPEAVLTERDGLRVLRARRDGAPVVLRLEARGSAPETLAELAVFAAVRHPGLARLVDFGELGEHDASVLWTAREWIEGQDLLAWSRGKPPEEIGTAVARLCPALEHLHRRGFVHADLKAENVLVAPDGRVVLTDFGLSRQSDTEDTDISGSLFSLAPEVLVGGRATPASDLFALGALLHRLLTDKRTSARAFYARFPARSFFDAAGTSPEELPNWARDLVALLTAREPARRPGSAAEVGSLLAARLGLPAAAPEVLPLHWPVDRGREGWMRGLFADLDERCEDGSLWLQAPAGELARPLFERLRLSSALGGAAGSAIDVEHELRGLTDGLALDRWADARARDARGRTFVCVEADAWQLRAATALARAFGQERRHSSSTEARLIFVAAAAAPPGTCREVEGVPSVEPASIEAFVRAQLPDEDQERVEALAASLAEASEGSATRLEHLLSQTQATGWLLPAERGFRLRPGTLPALVGARLAIEAATPDERSVLTAVWLCGGEVPTAELTVVCKLDQGALAETLLRLSDRHLVSLERGAETLAVRALVTFDIDTTSLAGHHARRAAFLRDTSGDELLAAAHAWAATRSDPQMEALQAVLADVRRRGCAERALETIERVEAWLRAVDEDLDGAAPALVVERGDAWCDLGRYDRAKQVLTALARDGDGALAARVELALARIAGRRHLADEAETHLARALQHHPDTAAEVAVGRIRLLHAAGKNEDVLDAARELTAAEPRTRGELSARDLAFVESLAAMSAFRLGRTAEARATTRRLIDDAGRTADRGQEAALRINLATIERRAGSLPEARVELERAVDLLEQAGFAAGLAHARSTLGGLLRELGEFSRAETMLVAALEARERLGDTEDVVTTRGMLGLLAFERGHARAAVETLKSSADAMHGAERRRFTPLLEAKADEMRARIGVRLETPLEDEPTPDPRVLLARARAAALLHDGESARAFARRALDLATSLKLRHVREHARALVAWIDDDPFEGDVPNSDALLRDDLRIRTLLASKGEAFDAVAARELAERFAQTGRDDRAARLWLALAARSADPSDYGERAERVLATCTSGLTAEEALCFRRSLLGLPDHWPGDLGSRPTSDDEEDIEMQVLSVLDFNKRLLTLEDLESLLGEIVEHALELTGAERGFLVLEERGRLRYDLALDSCRGDVPQPEFEISKSVVTEALERGETIRLSNAVDDPLLGHTTSVVALELRSILCVPFDVRDGLRGALYLDHRLRTGAFDEKADRLVSLFASQAALAIQQIERLDEIRDLNRELEQRVARNESDLRAAHRALRGAGHVVPASGLIGDSEAIQAVHRFLDRAAQSDLPVLVAGESGTGKELAARSLHDLSPRKNRAFVSENCAAIPASLVESELFGSVKGAYTGADQDRPGLFERADGGTLFLDEIGELPLESQAKLLRVLETGEVRRLGASETTPVDFRLVVATNRDLEEEVAAGRFRTDLFYRLDGLRLTMPPLSKRPEDVEPLVQHFLRLQEAETGAKRVVTRAVMTKLCRRPWPGNVRELKNEIARLCVLSEYNLDDPSLVREPAAGKQVSSAGGIVPLADLERSAIQEALEHTGGDKRQAARLLGISRATIYKRIKDWDEEEG